MKVLVLGSGGREHAIAWRIKQSENCSELFCLPGNPGTKQIATNLAGSVTDFKFSQEEKALELMRTTPCGTTISVKLLQKENVPEGITVMFFGRVMLSKFSQP